jgi:glutamate-5-semialdehyde dehydrogenase
MDVKSVCSAAKKAGGRFVSVSTEAKNALLASIRDFILADSEKIKAVNKTDLENARESGCGEAFLDRLTLTDARIKTMCDGIDDIIALPDYVGKVEESYTLKNGLSVEKVHAPLGVIGIIYESRPNVTVDAAVLCIKSGNGVVLKGGKESINSNRYLVSLMKRAFEANNLDGDLIAFVDSTDRAKTVEMLHCSEFIDVIIPRGGENLKKFVLAEATMPVIASSGGNCHVFVEKTASFDMAYRIIENAKISRPSVCNAAETLLVQEDIAAAFLPECLKKLASLGVEIRGTEEITKYYPDTVVVGDDEFFVEYDKLIIKVKTVKTVDEAIEHINRYGTHHSEAIVTEDKAAGKEFCERVDAGCVYVNASTRFTDGYELGLGAEMGISTQKLHVRGPRGL